jgi:dipeptidase
LCDTVVVVREGGVLFAKNSDRAPNEAQILDWQPRRSHPSGSTLRCTWLEIPQVETTWAVLLSRPFWIWGAEMGTNEHGVTIGNEAVFTNQPYASEGLLGMDLLRLGLERAFTAREAVDVITGLLETHGQGGDHAFERRGPANRYHNSFIVADPERAYVLETAGREWALEEVQGARSISNALTIEEFRHRHARRLKSWAISASSRRVCTTRAARAAGNAAAMMRLLRDHGNDCDWPRYGVLSGAMSGPCVHPGGVANADQTAGSWVSELRPGNLQHWATGTAAPCLGLFKPVSVEEPLDLGPEPRERADAESLWWRHEVLQRRVMEDPERLAALFIGERDALEARWLESPPSSEQAFKEADAALARWTEAVGCEARRDVRPLWARRSCARRDQHAGL